MKEGGLSRKIKQMSYAKIFGSKLKGKEQYKNNINSIKPGTNLDRFEVNQLVGTLNNSKKETNNLIKYNNKIKSSFNGQKWIKASFGVRNKSIEQKNYMHSIVTKSLIENLQNSFNNKPKQKQQQSTQKFANNIALSYMFAHKNQTLPDLVKGLENGLQKQRSLGQSIKKNTKGLTNSNNIEESKKRTEYLYNNPKCSFILKDDPNLIVKHDTDQRLATIEEEKYSKKKPKPQKGYNNFTNNLIKESNKGIKYNDSNIVRLNRMKVNLARLGDKPRDNYITAEEVKKNSFENTVRLAQEKKKIKEQNYKWYKIQQQREKEEEEYHEQKAKEQQNKKININEVDKSIQSPKSIKEENIKINNFLLKKDSSTKFGDSNTEDNSSRKNNFDKPLKEEYNNDKNNNTNTVLVVEPTTLNKENEEQIKQNFIAFKKNRISELKEFINKCKNGLTKWKDSENFQEYCKKLTNYIKEAENKIKILTNSSSWTEYLDKIYQNKLADELIEKNNHKKETEQQNNEPQDKRDLIIQQIKELDHQNRKHKKNNKKLDYAPKNHLPLLGLYFKPDERQVVRKSRQFQQLERQVERERRQNNGKNFKAERELIKREANLRFNGDINKLYKDKILNPTRERRKQANRNILYYQYRDRQNYNRINDNNLIKCYKDRHFYLHQI